jgi:hypothetical protein
VDEKNAEGHKTWSRRRPKVFERIGVLRVLERLQTWEKRRMHQHSSSSKGPRRPNLGRFGESLQRSKKCFTFLLLFLVLKNQSEKHTPRRKPNMADFVQKTTVKTAVRTLAAPIADVAAFNTIVQSVITGNPFACVAYETAGVSHQPVEKTKENYVVKIVYQDGDAKTVGNESSKFSTLAGFNAGATAILADTALTTAHGGTAVRDSESETFSATLKCRDPNGEIYMVTFGRQSVSLTSYSDDGIRTKVETWADTVAALAWSGDNGLLSQFF